MPSEARPRRRADAERSIAAILDAAVDVLAERPDASMSELATAAGVARQTIYAHYPSRDALLGAVADRALAQAVGAIDAAEPDRGDPSAALDRLVTGWWSSVTRYARVLDALAAAPLADDLHGFHAPIVERVDRLVRRGQRAGEFDRALPAEWLAAAFLGLMHTAADEVAGERLGEEAAGAALHVSVRRLFGAGN